MRLLALIYTWAVVNHINLYPLSIEQANPHSYLTSRLGIFYGIRHQINHYFVEIVTINPYWQVLNIAMVIDKINLLQTSLFDEVGIDITQQVNEITLRKLQV